MFFLASRLVDTLWLTGQRLSGVLSINLGDVLCCMVARRYAVWAVDF